MPGKRKKGKEKSHDLGKGYFYFRNFLFHTTMVAFARHSGVSIEACWDTLVPHGVHGHIVTDVSAPTWDHGGSSGVSVDAR
jgi:hypothetical protein